jgi:ATP-dependent Clp protease ATP-binding subunit ClpA
VSRLVGAPPGYVGYDEGGQLTEAVRRRPYSVVLLDEVEKAHPDVFNVLLQVMDEGRLTDAKGRTVDFRNSILIMTSNLGSEFLLEETVAGGFGGARAETRARGAGLVSERPLDPSEDKVLDLVHQFFRPEFLNRLDEILIFRRLSAEQVRTIVDFQLERVATRLHQRGIVLEVTGPARDLIARWGYDPAFGARPLKRVIRRELEDRIAKLLLQGEAREGGSVLVDAEGEDIDVRVSVRAA